jgi:hypothetical protein
MLVLPFLLALWLSPMLLFSTSLRNQKRRITIRDALIGLALLAVIFALLFRSPEPLIVFGLVALYGIPFLFAVLYLPRGWDVAMALTWSIGTLMALHIAISLVDL